MSMIHSHPVLDATAHAKSMIDAVTGHQPSPLDGEYSREIPATTKQTPGEKNSKIHRSENA
jgi:hypothetical protein